MVLWRKGGDRNAREYSVMVAPGVLFPTSQFLDEEGKPVQFNVIFRYGKTDELPSGLAQYLIDEGFATESRIAVS